MVDPAPIQQDMPVGVRFHPKDEELAGHYLRHKLLADDASIHNIVPEIDLCKYEPWELPAAVSALSMIKSDDPEWFFFSHHYYKYSNSTRCNRATSCGYWKATGNDRIIRDLVTNNVIGTKKTLVFYQGRPRVKTHWVIHEYHDAIFPPNQRTHVLCKLIEKSEKKAKDKLDELIYDETEPNDCIAPYEYENQANDYMISVRNFSYMEDSMMTQTPSESYDFGGSMMTQTPSSESGDFGGSMMTQTPSSESGDFGGSMMTQTPSESGDFGGSMVQMPLEVDSDIDSKDFDFRSFLRSSPSRDDE